MASQVLVANSSQSPGRPVTERAARFLPGLLMLVLDLVAVIAGVTSLLLAGHLSGGAATALRWLAPLSWPRAGRRGAATRVGRPAGRVFDTLAS